jgi:hypothetical protein
MDLVEIVRTARLFASPLTCKPAAFLGAVLLIMAIWWVMTSNFDLALRFHVTRSPGLSGPPPAAASNGTARCGHGRRVLASRSSAFSRRRR